MTDDATLSDFLAAESEADEEPASEHPTASSEDESTDDGDGNRERETERSSDGTGLSTYAWGEYTCSRCDTETDRVWREEGSFVCPECKSW